jgi:hypothetical protein
VMEAYVHQFLLRRPRSRNVAPKFHCAILSSPPSIQTMVPETFFFPQASFYFHSRARVDQLRARSSRTPRPILRRMSVRSVTPFA